MEPSSEDIDSALESFREQWRAEVRAKQPRSSQTPAHNDGDPGGSSAIPAARAGHAGAGPRDLPAALTKPAVSNPSGSSLVPPSPSALRLYEEAVEMEARGNLGDSLRLYRTAFRMDSKVDQLYKAKHFPPAASSHRPAPSSQPTSASSPASFPTPSLPPASASSSVTGLPAHQQHPPPPSQPRSLDELIGGFASLSIEPAAPEMEGMPQPPCPIASLPDEVLLHVMLEVAIDDVGDFVRLGQVCRRLAYLVATEERIWRRVCLGAEFGFAGMHRHWNSGLTWETEPGLDAEAPAVDHGHDGDRQGSHRELEAREAAQALLASTYGSSWRAMFRLRPRVRFNGCYISTVNYIRAGQASANQVTWNSPVHICTYFRYLRFFRDGTCISLLTTAEPAEVVQYLTKEMMELHRSGAMAHLPSSVMQHALKGRWRLGSAASANTSEVSEVSPDPPGDGQSAPSEGDVFVETEGVGKYMYRLDLALKTAGKAARNNKLAWKGFYSYNRLTDDWAEFGLKNDKPFIFSRVKRFA